MMPVNDIVDLFNDYTIMESEAKYQVIKESKENLRLSIK